MVPSTKTARDIMTKRVITVTPDQDLFEVIGLLVKNKISGAPVVDRNGKYLGIFSEKSSISLLMDAFERGTPTNRIEGFVDKDAATVTPDTGLLTIAHLFMSTHYRRVAVPGKRQSDRINQSPRCSQSSPSIYGADRTR